MNKIHRNLYQAVIEGLESIFNSQLYADKVVEKLLKKDKRWGAKDRAFISQTIYEIVRYKRLYGETAQVKYPYNQEKISRMFCVWAVLKGLELPLWMGDVPQRRIKGRFDLMIKDRKLRESIPDWLDQMGIESLGEEMWEKEIKALNCVAPVVLRVNRLKIEKEELQRELLKEKIETKPIEGYPDALILPNKANVFATNCFKEGYFEIQDASSQKVAYALDVKEGMRVADCCAGAGGKTLHLASLMKGKGYILAMDIYKNKLEELKRRAKRAGAFNIETKEIESKTLKRLEQSFDRVLIDAPCSGIGVLRRNPDAKWKLTEEFVEQITHTQKNILKQYSKLLKKNGTLVYSTCSIIKGENQDVIEDFLKSKEGENFEKIEEDNILAHKSGFDGFYICKLVLK